MKEYIVKTLAYNKQVRILFMDNTNMIKEVCNNKNISKLLKTALGKTLTITALISGILKGNQRISIKVNASNRNYKVFADCDSYGNVRGFINDQLLNSDLHKIEQMSIKQLIGDKGCIQVLKDLGMNSIFTGITDMPYGNIVDDFSYYFNQSEQTDTFFSVNLLYNENNEIILCRGIMVQLLPEASEGIIDSVKEIIKENQHVLLEKNEDLNKILISLFEDIEVMETNEVRFFCGCSKEMFYPMLYSLDKEEIMDALNQGKSMEIVCNVCGKKHSFNSDDLKPLI
ncbi:Hsp33 family molecular chaperone HslO [Clostridium sp. YIM B02505]|uniref:Hsp33 family molecular chaperone HslO n=1 Tax=Clostridium yunnanense TaxID=2800325 RepID=A0ABS1ERY6_9CLOT|nr:Hsp33 family molecular chaperone HslO [Clostridium yunnanense]MBK1812117.1 Hsp33 family molecular chaperone HslO [Clostridium yunnanense]